MKQKFTNSFRNTLLVCFFLGFSTLAGAKTHDICFARLNQQGHVNPGHTCDQRALEQITEVVNPQQATLSTGPHTLQYQLQGMGKPGTYIQFNFQDANGHDVPCGITTPL
jgi:hypothetical protein